MTSIMNKLQRWYRMFEIPYQMLNHGIELIQTVVDVEASTSEYLELIQGGPHHTLTRPYSCEDMVYLIVKGTLHTAADRSAQSMRRIFLVDSMAYAGQTNNFAARESSRTGPMVNSDLKICVAHNLSQYQKDCLETTLIALLSMIYGHRSQNNSPYPRFIY
ncbi:hypothetical protein Unana1_08040 [Umbelopsis nana]